MRNTIIILILWSLAFMPLATTDIVGYAMIVGGIVFIGYIMTVVVDSINNRKGDTYERVSN